MISVVAGIPAVFPVDGVVCLGVVEAVSPLPLLRSSREAPSDPDLPF